jgi:hypothetical protein
MNQVEANAVQGEVARFGLQICVGFPAAMFIVAVVLRKNLDFLSNPIGSDDYVRFLGYIFIGVSLMDGLAAFILKRRLISVKTLMAKYRFRRENFGKQLTAAYIPVFILCALPALYGVIFYFLGGDVETYVLISIVCPASFTLLRPRNEEIEKLADEIFMPAEDSDIRL